MNTKDGTIPMLAEHGAHLDPRPQHFIYRAHPARTPATFCMTRVCLDVSAAFPLTESCVSRTLQVNPTG